MKALTSNRIGRLGAGGAIGRVGVMIYLSLIAALTLPTLGGLALATGGMDLSWNTIDGGGQTFSTGGTFGLGGTIGQPDAGTMSGGTFGLQGGFWGGSAGPSTLVGHVTWQGRPAQPNILQQLPITITLKSSTTEINYASQVTDASGFFTVTVGNLPSGNYGWRVKGPKYLANSGSVLFNGASVMQSEMGLMKAGDANNDNIVSIVDFNILKGTFGKGASDP